MASGTVGAIPNPMSPIDAPMIPVKTRAAVADPALDRLERHPGDEAADAGRGHEDPEPAGPDPELVGGDRQHELVGEADGSRSDRHEHEHAERRIRRGVADRLEEWPDDRGARPVLAAVDAFQPEAGHGDDRGPEQQRRDDERERRRGRGQQRPTQQAADDPGGVHVQEVERRRARHGRSGDELGDDGDRRRGPDRLGHPEPERQQRDERERRQPGRSPARPGPRPSPSIAPNDSSSITRAPSRSVRTPA